MITEDDPWERLRQRHCTCLRSKEMYYDNGVPVEERGSSGIYWCSQTHKPLGPDGEIVGLDECGPTRSCHQK